MVSADPFPFCESCASWHAPGEHVSPWVDYWQKRVRFTFWYGWLWGACFGLFAALVAYFWVRI